MCAMQNLCGTARMFVSVAAMLLLLLGWGMIAVAWVAKRHSASLAGHAPTAAKLGGAAVLAAVLLILFYVSMPLLLAHLAGGSRGNFDPEASCYGTLQKIPPFCGNEYCANSTSRRLQENCTCMMY